MIIPIRSASVIPDTETVPVCAVSPCEMAYLPPFGTDVPETFTGPGVRVVMRIDDATLPLFFVYGNDTDFTIDYGDGVDSQDYILSGKRVLTTRDIPAGTELMLTVKNCDSAKFCDGSASCNPLLEIICVAGERTSMFQFAKDQSTLRKIHPGAFDVLPEVTTFREAFANCTALLSVPDRLCAGMVRCVDIRQMFYGCRGLESVGNEVFAGMISLVNNADSVFQNCLSLGVAGERLFADCTAMKTISSLFSGCSALKTLGGGLFAGNRALERGTTLFYGAGPERLPDDTFSGCVGLKDISEIFSGFNRLTEIQPALFADCPVQHAGRAFYGCSGLRRVAPDIIRPGQSASSLLWMFHSCTSLEMDINDIFTQTFPSGCNLAYTFYNCKKVTGSKSAFLAKFPSPSSTSNTFYGCSLLTQ